MEKRESRYVEISQSSGIQCNHCGYHNELTESLLKIQSYWLGVDLVEFSCIECGKPFLTSKDVGPGAVLVNAVESNN